MLSGFDLLSWFGRLGCYDTGVTVQGSRLLLFYAFGLYNNHPGIWSWMITSSNICRSFVVSFQMFVLGRLLVTCSLWMGAPVSVLGPLSFESYLYQQEASKTCSMMTNVMYNHGHWPVSLMVLPESWKLISMDFSSKCQHCHLLFNTYKALGSEKIHPPSQRFELF